MGGAFCNMIAFRRGVSSSGGSQTKQGWEEGDFPVLCETCLGENPFVRMTKDGFGAECKVCARPFTVFRWKPGAKARYKKTEICQSCSKMKNCCQTCLLDLEYGLPVQVRDALQRGSGASSVGTSSAVPSSATSREWHADMADRNDATGDAAGGRSLPSEELLRMARSQPYYKRNRAHVCSFWLKGMCNRGDDCPYRHEEPPTPKDDPLAKQNMKDRYHGVNDPVAEKMLKQRSARSKATPPEDPSITTLFVGNLDDQVKDRDLRDAFYAFGDIKGIRVLAPQRCAFVTFSTRDGAETAIARMEFSLMINGVRRSVSWAKPVRKGGAAATPGARGGTAAPAPPIPALPPGLAAMPPQPVMSLAPPPSASGGGAPQTNPGVLYPSMDPSRLGSGQGGAVKP